jgi:hypothetical protein
MSNNKPKQNAPVSSDMQSWLDDIDFADFDDFPTPAEPERVKPKPVLVQPPKSGIVTVYSPYEGFWRAQVGDFCTHSTAEEAINYALRPHWDYSVGKSGYSCVTPAVRMGGNGWVCELQIHVAMGYFSSEREAQREAQRAVDSLLGAHNRT